MTTLDAMAPGESGTISTLRGEGSKLHQRMCEMGLVPGMLVRVVRLAPLGDPMQISVLDTALCLRKCDAARISVEPVTA